MLDEGAGYVTAAVARELRATLDSLRPEAGSDDDTSAFLDEVSTPTVPAPVRDPTRPAKGDVRPRGGQGGAAARVRADAPPTARPRREITLIGPRQGWGKTKLALALMCWRGLATLPGGPQRIVYTAQTRAKARARWEDDHVASIEASPLAKLARVRRRTGNESIVWRPTRSIQGIDAPTDDAGHGDTVDLWVGDEAWAYEDATVEQGLSPTMLTRPCPQVWLPSAAGTVRSAYLLGKRDAGRARLAGRTRALAGSTAFFEWSAAEDADPGDPETWWSCMPALGRTVTESAVRGEFERLDLDDFRRAYLAQFPDERPADEWRLIARED